MVLISFELYTTINSCNVMLNRFFAFSRNCALTIRSGVRFLDSSVQMRLTGRGLLDARAKARCTRIKKRGFFSPFVVLFRSRKIRRKHYRMRMLKPQSLFPMWLIRVQQTSWCFKLPLWSLKCWWFQIGRNHQPIHHIKKLWIGIPIRSIPRNHWWGYRCLHVSLWICKCPITSFSKLI